jgi:hypothetical protein
LTIARSKSEANALFDVALASRSLFARVRYHLGTILKFANEGTAP